MYNIALSSCKKIQSTSIQNNTVQIPFSLKLTPNVGYDDLTIDFMHDDVTRPKGRMVVAFKEATSRYFGSFLRCPKLQLKCWKTLK